MALDGVHLDAEPLAISLLLRPSAISAMISRSRGVIRTVLDQIPFSLSKRMVDNMSKPEILSAVGEGSFSPELLHGSFRGHSLPSHL